MKKLLLFTFVFFGFVTKTFSDNSYYVYSEQPISFTENNVSFAIYKNGAFDFYIDRVAGINVSFNTPHVSLSFNNGYNYNPYVQYDRYGAVIQVENIPIFYDYYGRVSQIGSVNINYYNGYVARVGGLHIYYNGYGGYARYSGYINHYNRHYRHVHHRYFAYPHYDYVVVSHKPYRRHYNPHRYVYHRNHHKNHYYKKKNHRYYAQNSKGNKSHYNKRRATQEIPKRKSDYQRVARRTENKKDYYRGTPINDDSKYRRAVSENKRKGNVQRVSNTSRNSGRVVKTTPTKRNATDLFRKDSPERRSSVNTSRTTRTNSAQKKTEKRDARELFSRETSERRNVTKNSRNSQQKKVSKNNKTKKSVNKKATNSNSRHLNRKSTKL